MAEEELQENIHPKFSIDKEYDTLRNEMLQGKKYVFERPLLIITVSIALIRIIEKDYSIYLPIIIIGLLLFNLWFTVNRIRSISRIIAYIRIMLEGKEFKWYGWETSLLEYRTYLKGKAKEIKEDIVINNELDYDSYYPPIFFLHVIVSCISVAILFVSLYGHLTSNIITLSIILAVLMVFLIFAIKNRPNKLRLHFEKNKYIWEKVFENHHKSINETILTSKNPLTKKEIDVRRKVSTFCSRGDCWLHFMDN